MRPILRSLAFNTLLSMLVAGLQRSLARIHLPFLGSCDGFWPWTRPNKLSISKSKHVRT